MSNEKINKLIKLYNENKHTMYDTCKICSRVFVKIDEYKKYIEEEYIANTCQTCLGIEPNKCLQFCKCGHVYFDHYQDQCMICNVCTEFNLAEDYE